MLTVGLDVLVEAGGGSPVCTVPLLNSRTHHPAVNNWRALVIKGGSWEGAGVEFVDLRLGSSESPINPQYP